MVEILLKHGADPNTCTINYGASALIFACGFKSKIKCKSPPQCTEIVKALLDAGAHAEAQMIANCMKSALHCASMWGHCDVVDFFFYLNFLIFSNFKSSNCLSFESVWNLRLCYVV